MIEEVVLNEVDNLLCNGARLVELLSQTGPRLKALLSAASRLGDRIRKAGPAEQRGILLDMVARIEVRQDCVRIFLHAGALREMIGQGKSDRAHDQDTSKFKLDVPVSFKRRGVEMKLVITDNRLQLLAPDPKLIAVVAQGCQWFVDIREGKVGSIAELAMQCGVDRTDVGRTIPFAFLAPDIVEAIIEGRQPVELTAARLKRVRDLPNSWDDQRRLLGFAR